MMPMRGVDCTQAVVAERQRTSLSRTRNYTMPTFSAPVLTTLCQAMFEAAGVPAADARVVAHSLVDANLCGHDSHGVMRAPQYVDFIRKGTYKAGVPLTVIQETPAVIA